MRHPLIFWAETSREWSLQLNAGDREFTRITRTDHNSEHTVHSQNLGTPDISSFNPHLRDLYPGPISPCLSVQSLT
jgi:hypothetical protein